MTFVGLLDRLAATHEHGYHLAIRRMTATCDTRLALERLDALCSTSFRGSLDCRVRLCVHGVITNVDAHRVDPDEMLLEDSER